MNTETDFITKDYLDTKLKELHQQLRLENQELKTEMNRLYAELFKWMVGLFMGVYMSLVLTFFTK